MPLLHSIGKQDYEDLRLTVVMNGGVSLAVWIGGIAQEIQRLQEGEAFYGQLIDFVATRPRVDVVSGTSAGGINGAFLAVARVFGSNLAPLRSVWLQSGSLDELLRNPLQKNPPSLLDGSYFYDELLKAFRRLTTRVARSVEDVSIELILTTTLLRGLPNRLADDFGALINDPNHRGSFHFRRSQGIPSDDFVDPLLPERLAVAARATASFPVAFEPVFCNPVPKTSQSAMRMDSVTSFSIDRYLLDGGILDNKPLDHALDAVAHLRFKAEVRRVICYVVPSPGESASSEDDDREKPPSIAEVAFASTSTLPMTQSISAQIDQIKDHNHRVRQLRQTRLALASLKWANIQSLADILFDAYCDRRADSAAFFITEQIVKHIVLSDPRQGIGRRRRDWIASLFVAIYRNKGLPWIPTSLPLENAKREDLDLDSWHWGLFTVENIASVILDVLRRGLHLIVPSDPGLAAGVELKKIRSRIDDLIIKLLSLRDASDIFWKERAAGFPQPFGDRGAAESWASDSVRPDPSSAEYGRSAIALVELLAAAVPHLGTVASIAANRDRWTAETDAANELQQILELIAPKEVHAEEILVRLLKIEVVQFAVGFSGNTRDLTDQILELVEICPDNSALLGLNAIRGRRPAGSELANFGGFYKKSWRANDWMLGRLHGAERLVRILLSPERIRRLYFGQDPSVVCQQLETIAVPKLGDPDQKGCREWWKTREPLIIKELEFLTDPAQLLPEELIHAAEAVLYRFQVAILREELPHIASAVEDDTKNRHALGKGQSFLDLVRHTTGDQGYIAFGLVESRVIEDLYNSCAVDQETMSEQTTSDRFAATITRAFAVGLSMLSGNNLGIPRVGNVARTLRIPALITDAISQRLLQASRIGTFAAAIIIGASIAVILLPMYPTVHIPWVFIPIAMILLVLTTGLFARHGKGRLGVLTFLMLILTCLTSSEIRQSVWKILTWLREQIR